MTYSKGDKLYEVRLDPDCCNWADATFTIRVYEILETKENSNQCLMRCSSFNSMKDGAWDVPRSEWHRSISDAIADVKKKYADQLECFTEARINLHKNYDATLDKLKTLAL